jgi:membrane protein YqaA with SNARE-associated domain
MHKLNVWMLLLFAVLKPLGIWGLGALALIDSALIPIPVSMDGVLIGYVASNHGRFILYCLMAAAASSLGSMVPYYVGRAGGELVLLKRINRERYERLRDRFENQEFLAIMIPAMLPPPTPIKLFEFAAGVFEMRPLLFATAIFTGKLVQFLVCALITIFYGPQLVHGLTSMAREHAGATWSLLGLLLVIVGVWFSRKMFAKGSRTRLPIEENGESGEIGAVPAGSSDVDGHLSANVDGRLSGSEAVAKEFDSEDETIG